MSASFIARTLAVAVAAAAVVACGNDGRGGPKRTPRRARATASPGHSPPAVSGVYVARSLEVAGEGCTTPGEGAIEVTVNRTQVLVRAADLTGEGTIAPDGNFQVPVANAEGRSGTLSGRFAGSTIRDGRLEAFGCLVTFEATLRP